MNAYNDIKIGEMTVSLPVRFAAGHVLSENEAKTLDTAYRRQFSNNQNANAKALAEKFKAALAKGEDTAPYAPLSADDYVALYLEYSPNVGTGGASTATLRERAAWDVWLAAIVEHNASVASGGEPVIIKAGKSIVAVPKAPRKGKNTTDAAHEAALAAYDATKSAIVAKLLASDEYADRIAARLDVLLAERGKAEADGSETVTASDDLV